MTEKFEILCPDCDISEELDPLEPFKPMENFVREPIKELRIHVANMPTPAIWGIDGGIVCCKKCGRIATQRISVSIP